MLTRRRNERSAVKYNSRPTVIKFDSIKFSYRRAQCRLLTSAYLYENLEVCSIGA